jgi:hypothetical protein
MTGEAGNSSPSALEHARADAAAARASTMLEHRDRLPCDRNAVLA